ncbi:RraA family protein [Marinomonas algicola]|jgi:regulator of RNase E activity RraA|uniref:RraA family protein n=1 Tax=Marinomonas algicola TaxID=2773454 RepID=UPI001748AA85|nr:RraA family protein [Marinomonas algicola]
MIFDKAYFDALRAVDTPSIANAIEVVLGKRQGDGFTRKTVLAANTSLAPICGYARTAKIKAAVPTTEKTEIIATRRMAYYEYMANSPECSIAVIEDLDYPDCVGAYWGEVNTAVHKGFGLEGTLTNGVMRDLDAMAEGYQVIAGSIGPSHAFVRIKEIDTPVSLFGLTIHPGDMIHADKHGAVVIPKAAQAGLVEAIKKMIDREKIVLDAAKQPGFNFESFKQAWSEFEAQREK